jgi:hypothetical protein
MSVSPTYHSPPLLDNVLRDLGNGIFCQFSREKQILVFTVRASTRSSVDTLSNMLFTYIDAWPQTRALKILYDFSDRQSAVTPYMRSRMDVICQVIHQRKLKALSAIVLPQTYVAQMLQLYYLSHGTGDYETQVFFSFGDAWAWLEQTGIATAY